MSISTSLDEFADLTDRFDFEDKTLDYVDGPLSGWVKEKDRTQWFAFERRSIVPGLLWHWTLVPGNRGDDASATLRAAAEASSSKEWLSILEDRRSSKSLCRLVHMLGTPPPIAA
jgi:hypothetical protein